MEVSISFTESNTYLLQFQTKEKTHNRLEQVNECELPLLLTDMWDFLSGSFFLGGFFLGGLFPLAKERAEV